MTVSQTSMSSAQPDPVTKPTRKRSQPKSAPAGKASEGLSTADLLTELQFLKGLVSGLQEEVLNLKQVPTIEGESRPEAQEPPSPIDLFEEVSPAVSEPEAFNKIKQEEPESDSAPIFQVEPNPDVKLPPIKYDDSAGPYQPFDPASFEEDFVAALEDPLPIDWAKWVEEENDLSTPYGLGEEEIKTSYEQMAAKHPSVIETVLAYNTQYPPDFEVESPFNAQIKAVPTQPKEQIPQAPQTAHDIMAELVAEAVQGQAVAAAAEAEMPEPEPILALSEMFPNTAEDESEPALLAQDDSVDQAKPLLDPAVLAQIPALAAIRACLLPLSIEEGTVTCGIPKPIDYDAIKTFEEETGLKTAMKPMGLREVVYGLREGYAVKHEESYRTSLLSGAAPPQPITLKERLLASIPFLKAEK